MKNKDKYNLMNFTTTQKVTLNENDEITDFGLKVMHVRTGEVVCDTDSFDFFKWLESEADTSSKHFDFGVKVVAHNFHNVPGDILAILNGQVGVVLSYSEVKDEYLVGYEGGCQVWIPKENLNYLGVKNND